MFFLRTESFSSSFGIGVLFERLIGQKSIIFLPLKFFHFWSSKPWIRIRNWILIDLNAGSGSALKTIRIRNTDKLFCSKKIDEVTDPESKAPNPGIGSGIRTDPCTDLKPCKTWRCRIDTGCNQVRYNSVHFFIFATFISMFLLEIAYR
jgi:hypothetical protein